MQNTIVTTLLLMCILLSCNSKDDKMNSFLSTKKQIENRIDSNNTKDRRFRSLTGYNEMDDSLFINKQYPHQELIDSIDYLKLEKEYLNDKLKEVIYSIDSLQKLQ